MPIENPSTSAVANAALQADSSVRLARADGPLQAGSDASERRDWTDRAWIAFTIIVLAVVVFSSTRWILGHSFGFSWDEALYFNEALIDIQNLHSGSLHKLGSIVLGGDVSRPPAYRLIALPFLAVLGFSAPTARFVSLALSGLCALFIFLTVRRIASRGAALLAVSAYAVSPEILLGSCFYSTQASLYLATSAMLYFLVLSLEVAQPKQPRNWIGLGLAIGLGFLSKTSFALIAIPVLVLALVMTLRTNNGAQQRYQLIKAGGLALLIAAPWWLKNARPALRYATYARGFSRNSLGSPSFGTIERWIAGAFQGFMGPGVSIMLLTITIVFLWKLRLKRQPAMSPIQRIALMVCAFSGLPLIAVQLSGTNHLLAHISPTAVPFAIALGVLSDISGWIRSRAGVLISGLLLFSQAAMIAAPVAFPNTKEIDAGLPIGALPWRTLMLYDQWDWKPLLSISRNCNIETPKIAYLGNGTVFNPPAIVYPWLASGASAPEVTWLWRFEQGTLNWDELANSIGRSDIVLTAPNYVGLIVDKQDLDNQHNVEFASRLARDSRFQRPIVLQMGRFQPVQVLVFVKNNFVCH